MCFHCGGDQVVGGDDHRGVHGDRLSSGSPRRHRREELLIGDAADEAGNAARRKVTQQGAWQRPDAELDPGPAGDQSGDRSADAFHLGSHRARGVRCSGGRAERRGETHDLDLGGADPRRAGHDGPPARLEDHHAFDAGGRHRAGGPRGPGQYPCISSRTAATTKTSTLPGSDRAWSR